MILIRFNIIIRLKDLSHVEYDCNTQEELDAFLNKYRNRILPHETIFYDYEKIRKQRNQEKLGWVVIVGVGLLTLFLAFK